LNKMTGALNGIRVIDLSHVLAAPTTTMFLADLGAEVIHVEPPHGDDAREFGPFPGKPDKNSSGYFISLNRNKKSIVLNLRSDRGKEILRRLLVIADVVVENYRPGTMKKLGFGWEELQRINPRLIYASISGFGHDAPPEYASRPSYDMVAQAYSGLMSITGPKEGPPCRVGTSIGDIIAGHQAAIGIMAALMHRDKTGRGQHYDGSMVDGLFAVLESAVVRYTLTGEVPGPLGGMHPTITPFQALRTKDSWIVTAIGNDTLWKRFCDLLGRGDLVDDPRFRTNPVRCDNKEELSEILGMEMKKKTTREWITLFEGADLPYAPSGPARRRKDADHQLAHPPVRNTGPGPKPRPAAGPAFGRAPQGTSRVFRRTDRAAPGAGGDQPVIADRPVPDIGLRFRRRERRFEHGA
jgi:CoA:oxalate CoA-transferase